MKSPLKYFLLFEFFGFDIKQKRQEEEYTFWRDEAREAGDKSKAEEYETLRTNVANEMAAGGVMSVTYTSFCTDHHFFQ